MKAAAREGEFILIFVLLVCCHRGGAGSGADLVEWSGSLDSIGAPISGGGVCSTANSTLFNIEVVTAIGIKVGRHVMDSGLRLN